MDPLAKCEYLLENFPDLLDYREPQQDAPIHRAALHGYVDVIALFVAREADLNIPGWYKRTPILHAAAEGHIRFGLASKT